MKVGYTYIRLAWAAIAHAQANMLLLLLAIWFGLAFKATGNEPPNNPTIVVPFHLVGKSIFVDATVNGQAGFFLFDTGAPALILNSAHLPTISVEQQQQAEMVGLYGEAIPSFQRIDQTISMGGVILAITDAVVLDLSSLEQIKHIPIAGILGYSSFKNYKWQLDFDCNELLLWQGQAGFQAVWSGQQPPTDSMAFSMSGHLPYVQVKLSGKRLRLGLDTGSERNLLQSGMVREEQFQQRGQLRLAGLSQTQTQLRVGFVHGFFIGDLAADSLEIVLADLERVSSELPVGLHGILGVAFFRQYKFAMDYQRQKIYFWRPTEPAPCDGGLALCRVEE